jgi:surface polysaccharide O-acyltransferase-like enzyme
LPAQRLAWIEAARTINCALVVLVHVNIFTRAGAETWWPGGFYSVPLYSLAVPSFMMIAGYVVDLQRESNRSAATLTSRLARLALPFLVWNVITLVVMRDSLSGPNVVASLLTGTWHLYFIFALLQLLVVYASLGRLNLVACVAVTVLAYALLDITMWTSGANLPVGEEVARKLFPLWIGFFAVGIWSRSFGIARIARRSWILILSGVVAGYVLYVFELTAADGMLGYVPLKQFLLGGLPFQILGGFAMLAVIASLETTRFASIVAKLGRDTYGIYLSHVAIMIMLYRLLESAGLIRVRASEVPVIALITFAIAWLFVRLVRRIPFASRVLLGEAIR